MNAKQIPERKDVSSNDKWDLTTLYKTNDDWEKDLKKLPTYAEKILKYKDVLSENADNLLNVLKLLEESEKISEKLGNYAFLNSATDVANAEFQDKQGRYIMIASDVEAQISFLIPEIQSIPDEKINSWIEEKKFDDYRIFLKKLLRLKPYILSEKEERIFALQTEAMSTAKKTFGMLTNVDLDFGTVKTKDGEKPLSQTTFSAFLENTDRNVRKEAYTKFYNAFDAHKNTIASLYAGSVNIDVFHARARGYSSSRAMELFDDNVAESVYDNLVGTIRDNFAPLHKYYNLRKKVLKLDELRHYDVYVPLVQSVKKITPYDDAVELLRQALSPLGAEYTDILCNGLQNGWVDKYENKGKRSGAFSSGGYTGYPYILMNYKDEVLRDVFTLAHEGGHSMHSYYSAKNNSFMQYNYTIFEAEVASTFNEELVFNFLLKHADNLDEKAYLLCNRASDILATLYRQTMFAEYEKRTHEMVENGTPLSADVLRNEYRKLLEDYFGPQMIFEQTSDLEGLRIPHFYNAFYVYKYATGISAALALAYRVLNGGESEKKDYFKFLSSGGSRFPVDSLKIAGVDMNTTAPIQAAIERFASIVNELEQILC
ncbi:MAG: oligoendopeptidase F [Treponema sp.]|nr:oligoendopeptidase F [Treponema sp.]